MAHLKFVESVTSHGEFTCDWLKGKTLVLRLKLKYVEMSRPIFH